MRYDVNLSGTFTECNYASKIGIEEHRYESGHDKGKMIR